MRVRLTLHHSHEPLVVPRLPQGYDLKGLMSKADRNSDGGIDADEFHGCVLKRLGMDVSARDARIVFDHFDRDGSGQIDWKELQSGMIEPLNAFREYVVLDTFAYLDVAGDGALDREDIADFYNVTNHPDVLCGMLSEDEVLDELLQNLGSSSGSESHEGITRDQFIQHYTALSNLVASDEMFETTVHDSWKVPNSHKKTHRTTGGGGVGGAARTIEQRKEQRNKSYERQDAAGRRRCLAWANGGAKAKAVSNKKR